MTEGQECYSILRDNVALSGYYCAKYYETTGEQEGCKFTDRQRRGSEWRNTMRITTTIGYLISATALIFVINSGCADSTPKSEATDTTKQSLGTAQVSSSTGIPKYTIIEDENLAHFKRSVDVRLSKKVSEEALHSIALEIKKLDRQEYDRTFMCYFLPYMVVNSGAWATTHFDPDVDVQILGLTIEDEKSLRGRIFDSTWNIVGMWLDERPYGGAMFTIYLDTDKLYLEWSAPDGVISTDELVEKASSMGRRFEEADGYEIGDYLFYLIDHQGNLQFWGEDGHSATARKMD